MGGPRLRATNPPPDLPPPPTCNPLSIHLPILLLHCIPEMAIFSSCITPIETKQQKKSISTLSLSLYLSIFLYSFRPLQSSRSSLFRSSFDMFKCPVILLFLCVATP